jgi:hypothetical protein
LLTVCLLLQKKNRCESIGLKKDQNITRLRLKNHEVLFGKPNSARNSGSLLGD